MKMTHYLLLVIAFFIVSGCSSGPLIKNHTKEVVDAGQTAIKESKDFFDSLLVTQNEKITMIYATHPDCIPDGTNIIKVRDQTPGKSNLCASERGAGNEKTTPINLAPLNTQQFQADMVILTAFSEYLSALAGYIDNPQTPISDLLSKAASNASSVPPLKSMTEEQQKAITDFASYLVEMARESEQGRSISQLVSSEGERQQNNMKIVQSDLKRMDEAYSRSMNDIQMNTLANYYRNNLHTAEFDTMEKREKFINKFLALSRNVNYTVNKPSAASVAIQHFINFHKDLIQIIKGNLSPEMKKEKVEYQKKQFINGLKAVGNMVKPLIKSTLSLV